MSDGRPLETLTAQDLRDHQGTRFRLMGTALEAGPPACIEVELVDVTEHAVGASGTFRTLFSVLFQGPLQPVVPQAIYRLEHERLGTLELFIVPIGPSEPSQPGEATAMRYQAVFG